MKITIEPTDEIADFDGIPCRIWCGTDDEGVPVEVMVRAISPETGDPAVEARYKALFHDLGFGEPTVFDGIFNFIFGRAPDGR